MNSSIEPVKLGWKKWIIGARPRTLPAAVVPVFVGIACASSADQPVWWRGLVAAVVSVALQIGVNYANDYSDGVKGTDAVRVFQLFGEGAIRILDYPTAGNNLYLWNIDNKTFTDYTGSIVLTRNN